MGALDEHDREVAALKAGHDKATAETCRPLLAEIQRLNQLCVELSKRATADLTHIRYVKCWSTDSRGKRHSFLQIDPKSLQRESD